MRFRWPKDATFRRVVLDVEQDRCAHCGARLYIRDHRLRRIYTLQGPRELCGRRAPCSDPAGPSRPHPLSPAAELPLALPGWLIGWDAFCRFARHWSVPISGDELLDRYGVRLPPDAVSAYLRRSQSRAAARQRDPLQLWLASRGIDALVRSIAGLQPGQGHETLYAVRERNAGRVWFAEALLASNTDAVRRLLTRARGFARGLGKSAPRRVSDKQDGFVTGSAAAFPGVPHRYRVNHFPRDLAKPLLEADSHAKVQMRKRVRGLRDSERGVRGQRRRDAATGRGRPAAALEAATPAGSDPAGPVVLDYCTTARGVRNDDQGGPLHPPGLRLAAALAAVGAR